MSVTGPLSPSIATYPGDGGDRNGGTQDGGGWSNPVNIKVNDGVTSDSGGAAGGVETGTLAANGFGFGIPTGSVIVGIKAEIKVTESGGQNRQVKLLGGGSLSTIKQAADGSADGYLVFGGPTDLWGIAWTAALVNNGAFGVAYNNSFGGNGGFISVDHMQITVYWEPVVAPQQAAEVAKRYTYKVYNTANAFLGKLPNVVSEFNFSQEINTGGAQITVECAVSADTSRVTSTGALQDESGATLTDESLDPLLTEGAVSIIAPGTATDTLIKNGNRIVVWEYSYYYPNGRIAFAGIMERWDASFGGDDEDNSIIIKCYSDGSDMDNYLLYGTPYTYTEDVIQTNQNGTHILSRSNDKDAGYNFYGQTFKVGNSVSNVSAIRIPFTGAADVTVTLYDSLGGNILASNTQSVNTNGGIINVLFPFAQRAFVSGGPNLFFTVTCAAGQSIQIYRNTGNVYSGGEMYNASYSGGSGGGSYGATGGDLWFITYSSNGSTNAQFSSQDPTNGILKTFMDDYISRGGKIKYTGSSIQASGISVPFQFNTATIYEGLQAILSVTPNGFYYYVDLTTNTLNFKKMSTTADIVLTKGKHLSKIKIGATIEEVANVVPFTGGEVSTNVNLYKIYQDAPSIARYGQRLDRRSNVGVVNATAANAIGTSAIDEEKDEKFDVPVTVIDRTMDITKLVPGKVIGFRGFGTFIDNLLLTIMRIDYHPEYVDLTLGYLRPTLNLDVEQLTRNLIAQETIYNPATPS